MSDLKITPKLTDIDIVEDSSIKIVPSFENSSLSKKETDEICDISFLVAQSFSDDDEEEMTSDVNDLRGIQRHRVRTVENQMDDKIMNQHLLMTENNQNYSTHCSILWVWSFLVLCVISVFFFNAMGDSNNIVRIITVSKQCNKVIIISIFIIISL